MQELRNTLIIIWILWIIWVSLAVYFKWTKKNDRVFYALYAGIIIAFGLLAITTESVEISSAYNSMQSAPHFLLLQHSIIQIFLTAFLQVAVWFFRHRWHRR